MAASSVGVAVAVVEAVVAAYPPFASGRVLVNRIDVLEDAAVVAGVARRMAAARSGHALVDITALMPLEVVRGAYVSDATIEAGLRANLVGALGVALAARSSATAGLGLRMASFTTHEHFPGLTYAAVHEVLNRPPLPPPGDWDGSLVLGLSLGLTVVCCLVCACCCLGRRRHPVDPGDLRSCIRSTVEKFRLLLWQVAGEKAAEEEGDAGGQEVLPNDGKSDGGGEDVPEEGVAGTVPETLVPTCWHGRFRRHAGRSSETARTRPETCFCSLTVEVGEEINYTDEDANSTEHGPLGLIQTPAIRDFDSPRHI